MIFNNLPLFSNRNSGVAKPTGSVNHAQDFSNSKVEIRREIEGAKTSINSVWHDHDPVTSISRVGNLSNMPTDSIAHAGQAVQSDGYNQAEADDKRYGFIRRLAMARKKEREAANQKDVYDLGIKSGSAFREKGKNSVQKKLSRLYRSNPGEFKNLRVGDRKYFADLVGRYAKKLPTGGAYNPRMKRQMTMEIEKKRRTGEITSADSCDMKKIINNL